MKNTLVVNIFGGPSIGKSTCATYIFSQLKMKGIDCEYVSEFAKDKVWEKNDEVFKCQFYVTGKQSFKISRCNGKVDVIITDSPIAIGAMYNNDNPKLNDAILYEFNKYNNLNIVLKRKYEFQQNGRHQNEQESIEIDNKIINWLQENNIPFKQFDEYETIVNVIENNIKNYE